MIKGKWKLSKKGKLKMKWKNKRRKNEGMVNDP